MTALPSCMKVSSLSTSIVQELARQSQNSMHSAFAQKTASEYQSRFREDLARTPMLQLPVVHARLGSAA